MGEKGYIKYYRSVLENEIVCKDTEYFAVWSYLLLNATHKERKVLFGGKSTVLHAGQLIIGRNKIAQFWSKNAQKGKKLSSSKVQRILKFFESEQLISLLSTNQNSLVTIINWNKYQLCEPQIEQQADSYQSTFNQQAVTNNNVKNDKNDDNEINKINVMFSLVKERLAQIYTPTTFRSWLEELTVVYADDNFLTLAVMNKFKAGVIVDEFLESIQAVVREIYKKDYRVKIVWGDDFNEVYYS